MRSFRSGLGGDFDRLWLAQLVSGCGSQVTYLAVPLTAALVLGASPAQMGLVGAVEQLPGLLFGLWAGVWADRLPRRALLIATDLGRASLVATIPAAALAGCLGMPWLYAVGFAAGAAAVVGGVAARYRAGGTERVDRIARRGDDSPRVTSGTPCVPPRCFPTPGVRNDFRREIDAARPRLAHPAAARSRPDRGALGQASGPRGDARDDQTTPREPMGVR